MRHLIILLFLLLSGQTFGQHSVKKVRNKIIVLARIASLKVKVIKQIVVIRENEILSKYYITHKNNGNTDTLFLSSEVRSSLTLDSCFISVRQLDSVGTPEVIIYLKKTLGSHRYEIATTEIWNIDTKKQIFQGVNSQIAQCDNLVFIQNSLVRCDFAYSIKFDEKQNIIVENLDKGSTEGQGEFHLPRCSCDPSQRAGIYSLVNGIYVWTSK